MVKLTLTPEILDVLVTVRCARCEKVLSSIEDIVPHFIAEHGWRFVPHFIAEHGWRFVPHFIAEHEWRFVVGTSEEKSGTGHHLEGCHTVPGQEGIACQPGCPQSGGSFSL